MKQRENKVKISHECPLKLLPLSRNWNDYDYALVHLFEHYPTYFDFYRASLKMGRKVILDNSIFELGKAFDPDRFACYIKDLKPTEYVVPDVFEDCDRTIAQFEEWLSQYGDLPGKKIGVVHGRTYKELVDCYTYMSKYADKIAINFINSYYEITGLGKNKAQQRANGRYAFISRLMEDSFWNAAKPHHLLGGTLPQEFVPYWREHGWNILNIETLDTSNPVVHGLLDIWYGKNGLEDKQQTKMIDLFESDITPKQVSCIEFNVQQFKKFCGRIE